MKMTSTSPFNSAFHDRSFKGLLVVQANGNNINAHNFFSKFKVPKVQSFNGICAVNEVTHCSLV
jgi:hypothetical protein